MEIISTIPKYLSFTFIILGTFFMFTGALGVLRMPNFFSRIHPAGITDSLGAPLVLAGIAIQTGFTLFSGKIMLLILFLLITNPTATHALVRSAQINNIQTSTKEKK